MRGLNEIVPIQDTFCSGLGAIERLDGNLYRFWFYVQQTSDDGDAQERVVTVKMVMPASSVPDAVLQTIASMDGGRLTTAKRTVPLVDDVMN